MDALECKCIYIVFWLSMSNTTINVFQPGHKTMYVIRCETYKCMKMVLELDEAHMNCAYDRILRPHVLWRVILVNVVRERGGAFLFSKMVPCSKPGGSTCHATTMSDIFSLNSQSVTMSYVSHSIFKSPSFCACDINRRFVRLESKNDCEANLLIYVFEHPIPMVGVLNNMFVYCMQAYVQFRFKQTSHNSSWQ